MIFQEMVKNRHQIHSTMNSTSIMKIDNLHNYAYVNYHIISKVTQSDSETLKTLV